LRSAWAASVVVAVASFAAPLAINAAYVNLPHAKLRSGVFEGEVKWTRMGDKTKKRVNK